MEDTPDHIKLKIAEYLSGYDLCVLSLVSAFYKNFCYTYEKILKIDKKMKEISMRNIASHFDRNGSFNAILITRPVCSELYLPNSLFVSKDSEDSFESEEEEVDERGITIIHKSGKSCLGSVFIDPNDGKKWCEDCMTRCYGERWKSWDPPRIATNTKFYVKIKDVERTFKMLRYTNLGSRLRDHYNEEYDREICISENILLDNGEIFMSTEDGRDYYLHKKDNLILNKREYLFNSTVVLIDRFDNL